ncbi:nicotinate-nicotinamide nucleotide adenylyltransferase, partial [Streptomyces microflavus]
MSERNRRVGVMGGTFDPIHHGHLVAASEVAGQFGLDEVVFVPTGRPWQKSAQDVYSASPPTSHPRTSSPRWTAARPVTRSWESSSP